MDQKFVWLIPSYDTRSLHLKRVNLAYWRLTYQHKPYGACWLKHIATIFIITKYSLKLGHMKDITGLTWILLKLQESDPVWY